LFISIREAFCAPKNKKIISLDYSHIELRILAHFSNDKNLLRIFKENIDIHSKTASDIFKINIENVNKEQRQFAKKINFGIIYGLTPFGLSKELKISVSDAKKYLDIYKETYPEIFKWINLIKDECEKDFIVKTFFGRERFIPEIKDLNKNIKNYGIRMAINTIIQGTAAEVVKLGMINVYEFLKNYNNYENKIVLQIHDEILIEAEEKDSIFIANECKKIMENVVNWEVKLNIEIKIDDYWN
jgi:DNA polymerase-1